MKKSMIAGVMAMSAMGVSRAEHAANITMASNSWQGYEETHSELFETNGLKKFVLVDDKGGVIARNSKSAELVKNELYNNSSTLRHEDFLVIQEVITSVRRRKLNGIADLQEAGFIFWLLTSGDANHRH